MVCLEDILKLPRADSCFSKTILLRKPRLIDYEVDIIYDFENGDSFNFLLATPTDLTLLVYNRGRGSAQIKAIIPFSSYKVIFVMSVSEILVEGPDV